MHCTLFEPLDRGAIGSHRWLRRHEIGRIGQPNYRMFEYLPRISVGQARRIVDNVRRAPASGPLRDQLAELIRQGLGVPQDLDRLAELRDLDIARDPEKLQALNAYLDGLDASITTMERYMSPWPFLPSADWVAATIGHEAWPFFRREKPKGQSVSVPDYAAYGILIYMQDGVESKTYTLCDSYVLKRKNGVVAIPTLFAHQQSPNELPAGADRAKTKRTYTMRSRIRGTIDVTGVMKSDRKYFALFGLFYFHDRPDQAQLLNKAFKVDVYKNLESDVFGQPERVQKLKAALDELRPRHTLAADFVARNRARVSSGNPSEKLLASFARAEAVIEEFDRASRRYHDAAESAPRNSPIRDLSFYALDVMLPSTFKPEEIEWRPILTDKYARVADRLYGNDKTVNKSRTVQFSLTPKGSRIW
jgi:hypothetical protein